MHAKKIDNNVIEVRISRRNLTVLLDKLDNGINGEESACTIFKEIEDFGELILVAESDEEHYTNKGITPGVMHPDTESRIS